MSKWGKSHGLIVPIDSLLKEKENTNRPAPLRSAGLVGRWGITSFTSIRNTSYEFESTSPKESDEVNCTSNLASLSTQVSNPIKPKKFFKSRNTVPATPDPHRQEAFSHQQHPFLHHQASQLQARIGGGSSPYTSPGGGYPLNRGSSKSPAHAELLSDTKPVETKKEKPKKKKQKSPSSAAEVPVEQEPATEDDSSAKKEKKEKKEKKPKKVKKEAELPPELPKRNSTRIRNKVVNYNEDDDSYDSPAPYPPEAPSIPISKLALEPPPAVVTQLEETIAEQGTEKERGKPPADTGGTEEKTLNESAPCELVTSPPQTALLAGAISPTKSGSGSGTEDRHKSREHKTAATVPMTLGSPSVTEHPPIVLRISKGTSRLISTDSEDVHSPPHAVSVQPQPPVASQQQPVPAAAVAAASASSAVVSHEVEEQPEPASTAAPAPLTTATIPTIVIKPVVPLPLVATTSSSSTPEQQEQQPRKEDLKIKISLSKSLINNAGSTNSSGGKSKKESKKELRHFKKRAIAREKGKTSNKRAKRGEAEETPPEVAYDEGKDEELLAEVADDLRVDPIVIPAIRPTFPLPGTDAYELYRTLASPSGGDDFDSQSSILGSASSNNTPKHGGLTAAEDCRIIHSRGSSDCGSDLELSQNSSTAAAPPSEINFESENTQDIKEDEPKVVEEKKEQPPPKEERVEVLKLSLKRARVTTRATRSSAMKNAQIEVISKPEPVPIPTALPTAEPPIKKFGRSTRNRNNNNVVLPEEKQQQQLSTESEQPAIDPIPIRETTPPLAPVQKTATRQYSRRKKNIIPPDYQPDLITSPHRQTDMLDSGPPPFTLASESESAIAVTKSACDAATELDLTIAVSRSEPTKAVPGSVQDENNPEPTEYKIKNKFKRSYFRSEALAKQQQQHQQQQSECRPLSEAPANNTIPSAAPASTLTVPPITIPIGSSNTQQQQDQSNLQQQPVKLVISKKKGSIFKSRPLTGSAEATDKKRHVYKHKWDDDDDDGKDKSAMAETEGEKKTTHVFEGEPSGLSRVTRARNSGGGSCTEFDDDFEFDAKLKCDRDAKPYYTVVRNVKKAHQIQEIGESQEMDDDVEYILSALQPDNPNATRCLSAMTLATKCMTPAFRMHVRAHGVVTRFFKALSDAHLDQSLGLCTATIMFVLSQDTLNMDLDRDSLELMLNLLDADHRSSGDEDLNRGQLEKNKQKVHELCEEIKNSGKAKHMDLENITVGSLAMESLLSLTSKRAGDWFKDELRNLGGLEHLIKTVSDCCRQISDYVVEWTDDLLSKLRKIERCLRVLENVTLLNEENQSYILQYDNGKLVHTLAKLLKLVDGEVVLYPTNELTPKEERGAVLREVIIPVLKIFISLTHPFNENAYGASVIGPLPHVIATTLHLLLRVGEYVPQKFIFEMNILVLLFLINLTMYTKANRKLLMAAHAPDDFSDGDGQQMAIDALVEYFHRQDELARYAEKNTDAILDAKSKRNEDIEETVTKLLQKAGHHMEHTLMASYVCLLIGWLVMGSEENEATVRTYLKDNNFVMMVSSLEKYYNFLNLTANSDALSLQHVRQTKNIIDNLKRLDSADRVASSQPSDACSSQASGTTSSSQQQSPSTPHHRYGSRSSTRAHY
ncbi:protein wings apart-like [Toxorhynchites rutilus septentrionalis]|uniref:protein wings apart-like n=1 Tax=Toxorhynchites rutilus septentrionalis TaxID=329112 RepID=UPI002478DC2D|nr:protein wings apart-like [Toxorhynchites rutilus septentrionalis]XP_055629025.1 protein wings apart-like [Toxorhynchites rutilus septentrionalis]